MPRPFGNLRDRTQRAQMFMWLQSRNPQGGPTSGQTAAEVATAIATANAAQDAADVAQDTADAAAATAAQLAIDAQQLVDSNAADAAITAAFQAADAAQDVANAAAAAAAEAARAADDAAQDAAQALADTAQDTTHTTDIAAVRAEFAAADTAHAADQVLHVPAGAGAADADKLVAKNGDGTNKLIDPPSSNDPRLPDPLTGLALQIVAVNAAETAFEAKALATAIVAHDDTISQLPGAPTTSKAAIEALSSLVKNLPAQVEYLNVAAALADVANQPDDTIAHIIDGSADAAVTAGWVKYQKIAGVWEYFLSQEDTADVVALSDIEAADREGLITGTWTAKQVHDQIDTAGYIGEWDADSGAVPSGAVLRKGNWFAVTDATGWNIVDGQFFAHGDVLVAEVDTPGAAFNTTDWRIIPTAGGTIHLNTTADLTTVTAALGILDRNRSFYVIEVGRTYSWDGANIFENASGQRKTLVANLTDLANLPSGPHTNGEARPVTSERQDYVYFNDADAGMPGFVAANNVVGGWVPTRLPDVFAHTGAGPFTAHEGLLNTYPSGETIDLPAAPSSNTVLLATQEGETGPVQTYRSNDAGDGWINISQADGDDQAAAWESATAYAVGDVASALEPDAGDADFGQPFNWYRNPAGTSGATFDVAEKANWIRMALDTDPANWVEQDSTTDTFPIVTYGGKTRIVGDGTASTVVNVPTPGGVNADADFQVMNLATVQIQVNMGSANTRPIDGLVDDPDTLVELEPGERLRGYSLGSFDTRYEVIGTGAESAPVRHYTTANLAVSDEDQIAVFDEAGTYTLPAMSLDRRIAFAKTVAGAVTLTASGAEEFTSPVGTSTDQTLTINDILRFGTLVGKGDASSWSAFEGATTATAPATVATTISRHGASNPGNGNRFSHGTEVTNTGDIVYDGAGTYTIGTAGQYSVTYSLLTVQGSGTGNVTASLSVGGVPVGPTVGASNDTSNWAFNGSATITLTLNAGDTVELRQVSTPGFGGTNKQTLVTISGL